jgi:hypothetical protein
MARTNSRITLKRKKKQVRYYAAYSKQVRFLMRSSRAEILSLQGNRYIHK